MKSENVVLEREGIQGNKKTSFKIPQENINKQSNLSDFIFDEQAELLNF